jgi:predicted nucleotidyltransferase
MSASSGERLQDIARLHGVRLLLQFGSTVSGRPHDRSDVDVAALFDGVPTLERQSQLLSDLRDVFPGRQVDLGVLNRADPLFLERVVRRCRLLAGAPRALAELRLYAFRRYQDHRRFLALEERHVRRFVAERLAR